MKTLFYTLAAVLLLSSCSKYQMNVISSTNLPKDEHTGRFNMENDSVKIIYSFSGQNAPLHVDVLNKLDVPMYIDWTRSAFIVDNKAVSYADQKIHIDGAVAGTAIGNRNLQFSDGSINATATLPANIAFIPPHAQIGNTLLNVTDQMFEGIPDSAFAKVTIPSTTLSESSTVKRAMFTKDNSPLIFKSYLTLYTLNGNSPKYSQVQHEFFVSQIVKTTIDPANFEVYQCGRGDCFYTKKMTDYGKASTGVGIAAIVIGIAAIDASTHPRNNR